MFNHIQVIESAIQGTGVVASKNIKKGEALCLMRGERIGVNELKRRYASGKEKISNPLQIGDKKYIDLAAPYVFINHSCAPNCGIRKENELFALRDVKKGEELTFDYSTTEWTHEKFGRYREWAMECNCGSKKCRGTIGQFPSLEPKLKKQYYKAGALQDYILQKLEDKMFS
ncbi:MAG: SET domain-containing protein-lysine N-methyltransferase [Candidatus Iainarchaeum archaeon]|uniref:SET domain-containing protein-lysine N-methyltransferase n=1 Tax=Candidatus Iainarchaeum sp. TaxID=3101447 RepID=A0A7T9I241_9ARCH|nr:MAG: SET domain-containing protein-lysine N-methyltransferase [Candidatus Diapherotrites archaeon]